MLSGVSSVHHTPCLVHCKWSGVRTSVAVSAEFVLSQHYYINIHCCINHSLCDFSSSVCSKPVPHLQADIQCLGKSLGIYCGKRSKKEGHQSLLDKNKEQIYYSQNREKMGMSHSHSLRTLALYIQIYKEAVSFSMLTLQRKYSLSNHH